MDAHRRQWLETLAAACERVLTGPKADDPREPLYAGLLKDVEGLLGRIRAELDDEVK